MKKINNIFAYITGNYRYWAYNNYRFLLRKHIIEQYEWRLKRMDPKCYESGSCIKCGCDTPALQMANKTCEGGCYFEMYSKKKWKDFKVRIEKRAEAELKDLTKDVKWAHPVDPLDYIVGKDGKILEVVLNKDYLPSSKV